MALQNFRYLRGRVRRPLDGQNELDLLVTQVVRLAEMEYVLGSITLIGGEVHNIISFYGLNPAFAAEIEERFRLGLKTGSHY